MSGDDGTRQQEKLAKSLDCGALDTDSEGIDRLAAGTAVSLLVDIRTIPRSRHNPQFNRDRLSRALRRVGIGYRHMAGLGGLRHAKADSVNTGWRNESFRGYADFMQTKEFRTALRTLIALAKSKRVALMCAEAVPWRCHRTLLSDALVVRGFRVEEIESLRRTRPHSLTAWAHVEGTGVTYPENPEGGRVSVKKPPQLHRNVSKMT